MSLHSSARHLVQKMPVGARSIFTATKAALGERRTFLYSPVVKYDHNKKRIKLNKFIDIPLSIPGEDVALDLGPALYHDEEPYIPGWVPDRRADQSRKFSLRKRFFYERNRTILDRAKLIIILQPMNDVEFWGLMERMGDAFYTSHFRNGLVHIHDKPYAKIKGFFKGPVRVLLQDDASKIIPSLKKLKAALKEYPNTIYLGGAADGGAGLSHELDELLEYESKEHIQGQLVGLLNSISQICPVVDYATSSLARVLHHHGEQIAKSSETA